MSWWQTALGSSLGGSIVVGVVMLVRAFLNRPLVEASAAEGHASAAERLSDTAIRLIAAATRAADEAGRDAEEARQDAAEARREASDARRSAQASERAAEDAVREVRRLASAIWAPDATLERLRTLVTDPGANGVSISAKPI